LKTDENGTVTSETQYKAFGENEPDEKSHLYTGKEKDSSELYYFGSRYYDPEMGRFITRDNRFGSKYTPQSFNRYIYCLNNPLKYVDQDGRENSSWLFDQEQENKKVLCYSQAPQLLEYTYIEYDYTLFGWYCVISGVILVVMGAIVFAPYLTPLVKTLQLLPSKVYSAIMSAISSYFDWAVKNPLKGTLLSFIFGQLAEYVLEKIIIPLLEELAIKCKELLMKAYGYLWEHITNVLGDLLLLTYFDEYGNPLCGSVWSKDFSYMWKCVSSIYYVWIDNGWIEMPEGWKPGDPLP
jgi:RHS repeat-associated protein